MKKQKTYIIFINKSNLPKRNKKLFLMQVNIENKLCFKNTTNYIKSLKNQSVLISARNAVQTSVRTGESSLAKV